MIGMAIGPVRHRDGARTVAADERDRLIEMRRILADPAIGPAQVLAPRRAEHAARGLGFGEPLLDACRCCPSRRPSDRTGRRAGRARRAARSCRPGRSRDRRDAVRRRADRPASPDMPVPVEAEGLVGRLGLVEVHGAAECGWRGRRRSRCGSNRRTRTGDAGNCDADRCRAARRRCARTAASQP